MKKVINLLMIVLMFSSCYTPKKALKQVVKAYINYPELMPDFCAKTFPTKDSTIVETKFIKGKEIIKTETITIDCDSVVNDADKTNKVLIKYKDILRVDTVFVHKTKTLRDTALEISLQNNINNLKASLIEAENTSDNWRNRCFGLAFILTVLGFFMIKK